MKKTIFFLALIFIIVFILILLHISEANQIRNEIKSYNASFEDYGEKIIYGADVMTMINKAIDNNTKNKIQKDSDGNYIDDGNYCIKINLIFLSTDEEGKVNELEYPMERLEKAGLDGFITNFSLTEFECKSFEYNEKGRISKITIKQLEL